MSNSIVGPLYALEYTLMYPELFRPGFSRWVTKHWRVVREFFAIADDQWEGIRGLRAGLSARSVAEAIRDQGFELNGNFVPDIALLYEVIRPERHGLFAKRKRRAV